MKTNLEYLRKKMGLLPVLLAVFFLMAPAPVIAEPHKGATYPLESPQAPCDEYTDSKDYDKFSHCSEPVDSPAPNNKWDGYLELLGKPGTARSLGQTDLFVPLAQDENDLTFFNQRSQIDNDSLQEHNFGIGHRHMFDKWILGAYGYYDYRNTESKNSFEQGTVGLEALSESFDVRVNGYITDNRVKDTDSSVRISGNQVSVLAGSEKALPGFDGEVGYKLPVLGFLEDTRLYLGGYHFNGGSVYEDVSGPRVRLEARVHDLPFLGAGSRLMLGVEAQHDDPRGTQTFGLLSVRIPFGIGSTKRKEPLKGLDRRMMQPVVRDIDVVTSGATRNVDALNPAGKKYEEVVYWENTTEMENYLDALTTDKTVLGVMVGDPNLDWNMAGWRSGGENQVGGVSYVVAGKSTPISYYHPFTGSKNKVGFVPKGIAPTMTWGDPLLDVSADELELTEAEKLALTEDELWDAIVEYKIDNDINMSLITLNPEDHINGWDMDAERFISGLLIDDEVGDYYITSSIFRNATRDGVTVQLDGGTVNIEDSVISGSAGGGVIIAGNSTVTITGSTISDNAEEGVTVADGATIDIKGSLISGNGDHGVLAIIGGTVNIEDSAISGSAGGGVIIAGNSIATITDSVISGNAEEGVTVVDGVIDIKGSLISGNGGHGVLAIIGGTVNIEDSAITGNGEMGVEANSSKVTIKDSTISGNRNDGVIALNGSTVNIEDSAISGNLGGGVWAQNDSRVTIEDSTIFGNKGSGLLTESWDGAVSGLYDPADVDDEDSYVESSSQITAHNVTIYGNGDYGVLNRGGQITITNSPNIFGNGKGNYFNQTGILIKPIQDGDIHRDHCILGGGTLKVDGVLIPGTDLIPLPAQETCLPRT